MIMKHKIEEEIIEMQGRAKRKKSKWNLLFIPLNIFFIALFSFWYYKFISIIMSISFIARSDIIYIYYPNTIWTIALILVIWISSVLLSLILSNFILWFIKPIREIFEKEAKLHKGTNYKSIQKKLLKIFFISFFIWLPFIYMYMNVYNALSYKWLVYSNSWYNLREKEYNIEKDLDKIKIKVYKNKKESAKLSFKFIMKDDNDIEFSEWNEIEFLNKYWEFEQYLEKLLKYKIFYNVDEKALNSLLKKPKFKNKELQKKLLNIWSEVDIEYEKLKNNLEKNPKDDLFKIEFGFYEIFKNRNYIEWVTLYSWISNLKKIEICNDNKCLNKIEIINFENIKNIFSDNYWGWSYIKLAYQRFLISLIYSYIELWDYTKAYYYNGKLISEFIQQLNINAHKEYQNIFKTLPRVKVEEYRKYLKNFDRIPWDIILWDIQLYYEDTKNTFYTTKYPSSYYYNQLGLFYEYLKKYDKATNSYKKAYKEDGRILLTLRNLCISKYLDTKSKVFVDSDKIKYKNDFENSLKYCLDYETKYEKLYINKNPDYKLLEFYRGYKWDYEILNYIWLNYWFLWKLDLAENNYKKSLENWWNKVKVYNNLWLIYEDKKEYKKAIEYYKKVLKLDEKNYNSLVNISKLYWILEDYENAIDYMLKVKKIVKTLKNNNWKFVYRINPYHDYLLCKWYDKQYWKQNILWKKYCEDYVEKSKNKKLKLDKLHIEEVKNFLK